MTSKNSIFILVILLLLTAGCTSNIDLDDNVLLENKVTIKGFYEEPKSLKDKQTIVLKGVSEGEFVEIVVNGEIADFEHVKLEWDEKQTSLNEKEILKKFDRLTNQTLVIKTYVPEGIPLEKVKWKSLSGKNYEHIIQESSMDDSSNSRGTVFYLK